ncbi:tail fiber protein [Christensenella massiliensis]|uniref:Tail fiber protein n=1 Tax=Christensenella massiliensis TaxID=1805714 RepID=A0AAU8A7I3_9FIRM
MALQDYKITEQDYTGKDVASLPDEPSEAGVSAAELKAAFDRLTKEVVVPKHNSLVDASMGTGGAGNIGAEAVESGAGDTVQSNLNYLRDKLKSEIESCIPKEDIVQVQGRSETKVMSQRAVSDAIDAAGGGGGGAGDAEPVGTIKQFGGETLPDGYLWCDGASYPANGDYLKLFEVIGTAYNGEDDAEGTFRVPDLRGRVAVGKNTGTFGALGKTGGEETHTLTNLEIPRANVISSSGFRASPDAGSGSGSLCLPYSGGANGGGTTSWVIEGGGGAHNNLQPYLVCHYIIKYDKTYGEIGVTAPPCIWEFSASDWILGEDSVYTLSIPENEHRRGEYCVLTALYDTSEEGKMKAVLFEMEKDGDGNITVYSDAAFPGTAYIDRVYMVPAGRVLTVNGQGPDADGDVTVAEVENAQKLGGELPEYFAAAADSLNYRKQLTSSDDLNDYFAEPGVYQAAAAKNMPSSDAYGVLIVFIANTYAVQLYFSRVQNRAYFRTREDGQAITPWLALFTAGSNATESDFNNIAKNGSYGIFGSGTDKHAPYAGAYGTLQVYQSNQYITQTFISVTDAKTSVRAYNGSVWTAWKTL